MNGRTRTATRVVRVGLASERKSRTVPVVVQKLQLSASPGVVRRPIRATGASHAGQASVP